MHTRETSRTNPWTLRTCVGLIATVFVLGACGSSKTSSGATATTRLPLSQATTSTTLAASTSVGAAKPAGAVEVGMANFAFLPENITVKAGDVVFFLSNKDLQVGDSFYRHNFILTTSVNGLSSPVAGSSDFLPGEKGTFVVKNLAAGTYQLFCSYHHAGGMQGTVTVTS
jgi:plastocyanin